MILAVFSDIHANLSALQACHNDLLTRAKNSKLIILGDYIDYGTRPNETIDYIEGLEPFLILRGNHENAIVQRDYSRFSSARGVSSLKYTASILTQKSEDFVKKHPDASIEIKDENNKSVLFIHGDLSDPFWGKMSRDEMADDRYMTYDIVISGHTHIPNFTEVFYTCNNPEMRNVKKTIFLNPGSVGQPRNHCAYAQYLTIDTETEYVSFNKVAYDIEAEQKYYGNEFHVFYKDRLGRGL